MHSLNYYSFHLKTQLNDVLIFRSTPIMSNSISSTKIQQTEYSTSNTILPSSLFISQPSNGSLLSVGLISLIGIIFLSHSYIYIYLWRYEFFFLLIDKFTHRAGFFCCFIRTMQYNTFSFVLLSLFSLCQQAVQQNLFHFDD